LIIDLARGIHNGTGKAMAKIVKVRRERQTELLYRQRLNPDKELTQGWVIVFKNSRVIGFDESFDNAIHKAESFAREYHYTPAPLFN
jgi:hypothetical protein